MTGALSVGSAALLASFGSGAIVQANAGVRAMPALMQVSAATVLILGLRRIVPAPRFASRSY
jgi:hypothetical protein